MIRVTVELVPFGNERKKKTIGQLTLINDGSGDVAVGNYEVELKTFKENGKQEVRNTTILDFPRLVGDFWDLLFTSLDHLLDRGPQ